MSRHPAKASASRESEPRTAASPWFSHPRDYLGYRFVYAVISQRARGLSIGVNLTPDRKCNFDCVYCEVNHGRPVTDTRVDVKVLAAELSDLLGRVRHQRLDGIPWLEKMPAELLELKEVALSGDGEPTLCPNFLEAVEAIVHCRAMEPIPFKLVLITNTSGLGLPAVDSALRLFTRQDEVWVKLDAGTQAGMNAINRSPISLAQVLENILTLARRRPVVVQSLFPLIGDQEPSQEEIEEYVTRLRELRDAGAQISLVQIYSAHRPPHRLYCAHLPLKSLSAIARRVRDVTGLRAEVF